MRKRFSAGFETFKFAASRATFRMVLQISSRLVWIQRCSAVRGMTVSGSRVQDFRKLVAQVADDVAVFAAGAVLSTAHDQAVRAFAGAKANLPLNDAGKFATALIAFLKEQRAPSRFYNPKRSVCICSRRVSCACCDAARTRGTR